jgi:hypothetical protein
MFVEQFLIAVAVAEKMHLTQQCVGKWRSRFVTNKTDVLGLRSKTAGATYGTNQQKELSDRICL